MGRIATGLGRRFDRLAEGWRSGRRWALQLGCASRRHWVGTAKGIYNTATHPVDTATGIYNSWSQKFAENPSEAFGEIGFGFAFAAAGSKAADLLGPETKFCFPAGTLVHTSDGQKRIEDIKPEDRVWAFDLLTGQWRPCAVRQTFCTDYDGRSVNIAVAGESIEATYLHPFWVVSGDHLEERPRRNHLPSVPKGQVGR